MNPSRTCRHPRGRATKRAIACCALVAWSAGAAASVIVVRSNRPDFPVGRTLPDNVQLQLGSGETVTILGAAGSRIFRGPGRFSPAAPVRPASRLRVEQRDRNRNAAIRMSELERGRVAYRESPHTRRRVGGFIGGVAGRIVGAPAEQRLAIWDVVAVPGGTFCVRPGGGHGFWRGDARAAETLTIIGPDGAARTLSWPFGEFILHWPSDFVAADGAEYELRLSGAATASRIRVALLAADPATAQDAAAAFIERGCQHQLDRLIDATLVPEPAPAG